MFSTSFLPAAPEDMVPLDEPLVREIRGALARLGYWTGAVDGQWSPDLERALFSYEGMENPEERHRPGPGIDRKVLSYLHRQAGTGRAGTGRTGAG